MASPFRQGESHYRQGAAEPQARHDAALFTSRLGDDDMPPQIAHWIALASAAACFSRRATPPDRAAASVRRRCRARGKAAPSPPKAPSAAVAMPSMQLPAGPIYACDIAGARTPIEFPTTSSRCRRHPEMGPCQYERNACRRGGRVYTSNGEE